MLKLEKSKLPKDITISFSVRDPFWNRTLYIALGCALALHISAILLFQIQSLKPGSAFVFPPIQVQTHLPTIDTQLFLINENLPSRTDEEFLHLISLNPSLPKISEVFTEKNQLLQEKLVTIASFESLERQMLSLATQVIIPHVYCPIQFHISGQLAQRPLIQSEPIKKILNCNWVKKGTLQYYSTIYQVQVEPTSGMIFWYEKKQTSGQKKIDLLAEQALLSLHFAKDHPLESLNGEIVIYLTIDNEEDFQNISLLLKQF